nr:MAG TPA: hypothetical protein [Caudoviricetes sp.]
MLQTCFPTGYKRRTAQQQTPHDKNPAAQQRHGDTAQQQAPKKFQKKIFKTCYKRRSPRGNNRTPHNSGGNKFNSTGQNGTDA